MELTHAQIIELLDGPTAVARLLNIKPPSVHAWITDGIPEPRLIALAAQIELKSGGQFSRKRRWPDKFHIFWPELIDKDGAPPVPAEAAEGEGGNA